MDRSTSRRGALTAAAAATAVGLGACAAPQAGSQQASGSGALPRRNFVLVHGAWHGGWCWIRVRDALEAQGHRVYTPTLAGLADKRHLLSPNIDLRTHVADVVNLIRFESLESVTLVGHSYAGLVISEVVEQVPASIQSLIYVDAFMLDNGQSLADFAAPQLRSGWEASAADSGGMNAVKPPPAAFFRVNEADRPLVDAKCTPHPFRTMLDKQQLTGARDRVPKKAYIRAGIYAQPAFEATYERRSADPGWKTAKVQGAGHDIMLDAPGELAGLILKFS